MRTYYPQCRVNVFILPQDRDAQEPGSLLPLEAIVPLSASVQRREPTKCDKYTVKLDASYFPLDPRGVKTILVDVHMGDTGGPGRVLDATSVETQLIIGHADKISVDRDNNTVELEGRDYTSFFLDVKWGELDLPKVKLGRPLDVILDEVMDEVAAAGAMDIIIDVDGGAPIVPKGLGKKGAYYIPDYKSKVWDELHSLAHKVGVLLTVQGDAVVIQEPRNTVAGDRRHPVFVDGRNLTDLKYSRDFETQDLPNVRVKATDPKTRETVEGTYPDPPHRAVKVTRGKGGTKTEKTEIYHEFSIAVPEPTEELLVEVAKRVWEGWKFQQLSASWKTKEMKVLELADGLSLGRGQVSYNVTQIGNGTPVRLHVDRKTRSVLERAQTPQAKRLELARLGYRREVAKHLAADWHHLDRIFYVAQATHRYSEDSGYSLSIDAKNAVEV